MIYRSKFETEFAKWMKKCRIKFDYEPRKLEYTLVLNYIPDWEIKTKTGKILTIETKGKLDYEARRKLLAVQAAHPTLDLRIVFQNASVKLRKGGKLTYGKWATKNGFKWSERFIPPEWMKE